MLWKFNAIIPWQIIIVITAALKNIGQFHLYFLGNGIKSHCERLKEPLVALEPQVADQQKEGKQIYNFKKSEKFAMNLCSE